jgi:hypothetical protein
MNDRQALNWTVAGRLSEHDFLADGIVIMVYPRYYPDVQFKQSG